MTGRRVDYDRLAARFDRRYEKSDYTGVAATLDAFAGETPLDLLEVGCGTGHWLAREAARGHRVAGVEPARAMLARARVSAPAARVARGRAEALPWPDARFDRVFCINAYHHFTDAPTFLGEALRVLRPGGALQTIGLDPHDPGARWWIYDWFEPVRALDLARYRPTAEIRAAMTAAGFARAETSVAQHLPHRRSFAQAERDGRLEKGWTSQLAILSDAEFETGIARLRAAAADAARRGEELWLEGDLRLFATTARKAPE